MAQSIDKQVAVASIYADALYGLARERGMEREVGEELEELERLYQSDPLIATFLASPALNSVERRESLERMLRGRISDITLNTLLVMNRNDRSGLISVLRDAYELRQRQSRNEVEVIVGSAFELDNDQRNQVERTAAELSGKKPVIRYEVRPELLGGLVIQIGDLRYDYSVRRQLLDARSQLVERGESGLRVGVEQ